jgi:hypothetical protein
MERNDMTSQLHVSKQLEQQYAAICDHYPMLPPYPFTSDQFLQLGMNYRFYKDQTALLKLQHQQLMASWYKALRANK